MLFKNIYEAICGTTAGSVQEYLQKKMIKKDVEEKCQELQREEIEQREELAKLNKEFNGANNAREQRNNEDSFDQEDDYLFNYYIEPSIDDDMGFDF